MKNEPLRACVTTVEDEDHGALLQVKFDTPEAAHLALRRLQDIETLRQYESPYAELARDFEGVQYASCFPLPRHRVWGAGEADCPADIKASNGELHTLRCKVCGLDYDGKPCRGNMAGGGKVLTLDPTGGEWIVRTNRESFRLSDLIALAYDIDQAQGVNPIREAVIDVGAHYSGAVNAQFLHDSTIEEVAVETYKDSAVYVGRYQCGLCKEKDAT
jgi:hypothetical protein